MEYEFYIDLFFLTECFFHVLVLILTAGFLRQKFGMVRIVIASAIGSFWNCFLILVPVFSTKTELWLTIICAGSLMLSCVFPDYLFVKTQQIGWSGIWKRWVQSISMLLIASALVSGTMFFLAEHFWLSGLESLFFVGGMSILLFQVLKLPAKRERIGEERYNVRLFHHGKVKEFQALADSGNRLRVPDTGKPVVLISYKDCRGFCDRVTGGFYIPYRAVGTSQGLLFAVLFEKMEIIRNGHVTAIEHPAVAIVREPLSTKGDFNMILPEEYVPGE